MRAVKQGLTARELDVVAAWWHMGSVVKAAKLLNLSEQTAKNVLHTARMRTGAPSTLAVAQMYAEWLPTLVTVKRHARKAS